LDGKEAEKPKCVRKKKKPETVGSAEAPDQQECASPAPAEPDGAEPYTPLRENEGQKKAVAAGPGPVLVIAGPGTGKMRTLVERTAALLKKGVSARHILAVTFTRRAAGEMDERLATQRAEKFGKEVAVPRSDTLRALAFELWHKTHDEAPTLLSEEAAKRVFAEINGDVPKAKLREAWDAISLAREKREQLSDELAMMYARYTRQKGGWNLADYTDLLEFWLEQIQTGIFTTPWTGDPGGRNPGPFHLAA
jgi:superfamily I DNA/RNA helicase